MNLNKYNQSVYHSKLFANAEISPSSLQGQRSPALHFIISDNVTRSRIAPLLSYL